MSKRLPFRTAIAGLTALAITAPVIAPANNTILSAAIAQVQSAPTLTGPSNVEINTAGTFEVTVDAPAGGSVQFYLDGVALDGPVSLGSDATQKISKEVTPASYTNNENPHVLTARYFDADGYNTRADAVTRFQTPLDLTKLRVQGPGRNDGETTYTSSANGASHSTTNPLVVDPEQQITLEASVAIGGSWVNRTDVYEVGINPPAGTTYVSGKRTDKNAVVLSRGNGTGGYDQLPTNLSGVKWPSWGQSGYPSVTAGYFGVHRTDSYSEYSSTPRVQGTFRAPETPGIYVPQFAQFKYNFNTNHYLRPMENAVFRVKPQELPPLNTRPDAQPIATTITLDPNQTLTAGEAGSLTAKVTAGARGTVTIKNGDTTLGSTTTISADGAVTISNVTINEPGTPELTVTFTPAANANFAGSEGKGTVKVNPAPVKTTTSYTGNTDGTRNQPVPLKATVAPENASGTVTFTGNGNVLKADVPVVGGVAEVAHSFSLPSTYSVVAEFKPAEGSNFVASKSDPVNVAVKDTSTTQLTLSANTTVAGTAVTLTANVGPQLATSGSVQFYDGDTEIGSPVTIQNRKATTTYTPQEAGTRNIRAVFTPTGSFTTSEDAKELEVTAAPVETTVSLKDAGPFTVNEPGALTATVGPDGVEGTVAFFNGDATNSANKLGEAQVSNGTAALDNVNFDSQGQKTINVVFTPTGNFKASDGSGIVTVNQPGAEQSTLTISADETTVTEGNKSTLTATVTPGNAAGTVQFRNNGTNIGQPVTVNNGTAELTQALPVGTNNITAEFTPANANEFTTATAQPTTVTVNRAMVDTTIAYTGKPTHPYGDTKYLMEATVTDADGQPVNGGKVEFTLDGTVLAPQIDVKNGKAIYDKTFNKAGQDGDHTVTLRYIPAQNSKYNASTTTQAGKFTITKAAQTSLSVAADQATVTEGGESTLTATVTPGNAAGTVQFKNNGTNIGQPVTVNNGTAELTQALPAGTNNITAEFTPANANEFTRATAQATTITVNRAMVDTTIGLKASDNPTAGSPVTVTATVTEGVAGEVEFFDGDTSLGKKTVDNNTAAVEFTPNEEGTKNIKAVFSPTDTTKYNGSENTLDIAIAKKQDDTQQPPVAEATDTTVELAASDNPTAGSPVTITATVTEGVAGEVEFFDGDTSLGKKTVDNNTATVEFTPTEEGSKTIKAVFSPTDTTKYNGSENTLDITIAKKQDDTQQPPLAEATDTTVELAASDNPTAGSPITITATVTDGAAGEVEFFDGDTSLGKKTVDNNTATVEFTPTEEGTKTIKAVFTPTDTTKYNGSEDTLDVTIAKKQDDTQQPPAQEATAPTVTVTAPAGEKTNEDEVTLTAKVDPASAGTVEFFNGDTKIDGEVTYDPATGEATLTTKLAEGDYTITAKFTPDTDNTTAKEATSAAAPKFTVTNKTDNTQQPPAQEATAPTVTVTAPAGEKTTDDEVTLTAKVDPASAGTVEFFNGEKSLGTAAVNNGTATLTTKLAEGDYTITAKFTPASDNTTAKEATSEAAPKFTVTNKTDNTQQPPAQEATAPTVTVTAPAGEKTTDDEVTLTAKVDPASAGTVEFFNGDTKIDGTVAYDPATGEATLTTKLPAGANAITAKFTPAAGNTTAKEATSQVTEVNVTEKTDEQPNQPNPNQPNPNPAPAFTPEVKNETRTTTEGATLPAPSAVLSNASQILPGSVLYWSKLPTVADPVGEITVINPDGTTATAKVPFTVTGKTDTTNGNSSEGSSQSSEGSSLSRPAIIGISVTAVVLLLGLLGFGLANNQQFKDFIYTQFGIRL